MPCVSSAWLAWFDFVLSCMDISFFCSLRVWLLPYFASFRFSVWLFFFLRSSLFCCFVSPWLELCVGQRFHLRLSFDVACASARLVRVALSFRCGYWFLLPAVSF